MLAPYNFFKKDFYDSNLPFPIMNFQIKNRKEKRREFSMPWFVFFFFIPIQSLFHSLYKIICLACLIKFVAEKNKF